MQNSVLAVLTAMFFSFLTQPIVTLVRVRYSRQVQQFPEILGLQPFWGIAIGSPAGLLFLELVNKGWATNPPGLGETFIQALQLAGVSLIASPVIVVLGFPTFALARGLGNRWVSEIRLAATPVILASPVWVFTSALIFRAMIQIGFYPVQLTSIVSGVAFTLLLDIGCFEAIRRGLLRSTRSTPIESGEEVEPTDMW
jgi:hypothetical protein